MAAIPPPPGKAAPATATTTPSKPLQKPPGYRDPNTPAPVTPSAPPRRTPAAQQPGRLNRPLPPPAAYRATNGNSSSANGKPNYHPYRTNGAGGGRTPTRARRSSSSCCTRRRCCCCFLALILLFLLVLALAGGVAYLLLQPKAPAFRLQTLRVPLLRVSVRPDGTFLDANASVAVLAANPNGKLDLLYKDGRIRISAEDDEGDVPIGDPEVFDGFAQVAGNSTVLRTTARVKSAVVGDAVGARLKQRFQNGELRFVVEVRTRVAVKVRGGNKVHVPVRVRCGGVTLKEVGGGATTGRRGRNEAAGNKCRINLLRWINL